VRGKVVAITGAAGGIGRAHAVLLAELGARLVLNDAGTQTDGSGGAGAPAEILAREVVDAGGEAVANTDDIGSSDGADRLVATAIEAYGRLDGLVNNAGIIRDRVLVNMTDEDWDKSLWVNLRGTFAPSRAAARYWRTQHKEGNSAKRAIVNTSSESGVFGNAGQSNYAAAKSGVAALTEVWSKELSRYGVNVNGILPRARTRLTDGLMAPAPEEGFDDLDPANVSPFVAYLLSDDCCFSGQVFLVGGGLVQRAAPWSLDRTWKVSRRGRWTTDDLLVAISEQGVPKNHDRDMGGIIQ
jgi:NAD(P)-dependent dehydrogenase (short-subunit alcohol dehydrogenase family)